MHPEPISPDGRLSAGNRLDLVVAAVVLLFVALGYGAGLILGENHTPIVRAAGVLVVLGTFAAFAGLFRWAARSRWRYDQSQRTVRVSEIILVCAVSIIFIGALYEPLGPAAILVFAFATVFLVGIHLRRARRSNASN